jgi:hypothetical protein
VPKIYDTIQQNNAETLLKKGRKSLNVYRIVSFRVVLSDRLSRLKIPWEQSRESLRFTSGIKPSLSSGIKLMTAPAAAAAVIHSFPVGGCAASGLLRVGSLLEHSLTVALPADKPHTDPYESH